MYEDFKKYHESVKADRYRLTVIRVDGNGKKAMLIGPPEKMKSGLSYMEVRREIPYLSRLNAKGENVYITPLHDDFHYVVVDDLDKGNLFDLVKKQGYRPTVILETSPGNYQVVIPVRKNPDLDDEMNRRIGNAIAKNLNVLYGDPNFTGVIHPHRFSGFHNCKEKYKNANGDYPKVRIVWSGPFKPCAKTYELGLKIKEEIEQEEKEIEKQKVSIENILRNSFISVGQVNQDKMVQKYMIHYEHILSLLRRDKLDLSRVDSMIAMRLRVTGHSAEEIYAAIHGGTQLVRSSIGGQEKRWEDYTRRTVEWAFSSEGDKQFDRLKIYAGEWSEIESSVEDSENIENRSPSL